MKQVLRRGIGDMVVAEVPDPVPQPHQVLVHPLFSLISSGTETASIHRDGLLKEVADNPSHVRKILEVGKVMGPVRTAAEVRAKFSEYTVLGYSGAGVVVAKHRTVADLEVGDRVAYGGEGTGHGETVATGRNLVARVPADVSFDRACFTTLGSIALNAVRIASINLGDTVAVIGLGVVGQLIAQLVRLQGGIVIATDLKLHRVELARTLGAAHALVSSTSLPESVAAITNGRLADCVIIAAAAKSIEPCHQALACCRDRGRIVVVGAVDLSFPWNEMYLKEIQVHMSRAYGPGSYDPSYEQQGRDYPVAYVRWTENRNMEEFLRLLSQDQVRVDPLVSHRFDLDDAPAAYRAIMDSTTNSLAVLLKYDQQRADAAVRSFQPSRRLNLSTSPSASSRELRVALVGSGNLARWAHMPALKRIPYARLHAVHSSVGARGRTYGERFRAAYCTTDFDQILDDGDIDVVLITSRNQFHADQALRSLRAGKHVFVEKPMALTEAECLELCAAVHETGRELTVGFNRRFAPDYVNLKKALANRSGPAVVSCRVNSPGISGSYWMADPAIGGAILGEACHFVDLMFWLLESEPVQVGAFCLPLESQHPVGQNNMTATFRFADGSIGALTYSTLGSRTSGGERVELFAQGVGATAEDFKRLTIKTTLHRRQRRWFPDKGYGAQLEAFFECLRQGRAPAVTVRDGARATLGCLRMLEAARLGTTQSIEISAVVSPSDRL
jgi:predicted dehydrogenase/threonine dehydrogenase-like Zn-dependent dehydrogenase